MYKNQFKLETYKGKSSRYTCPSCHKPHEFTRYMNIITGEYLANYVGICNRRNKCGYHLSPKQYLRENDKNSFSPSNKVKYHQNKEVKNLPFQEEVVQHVKVVSIPDYIDQKLFNQSLTDYNSNNLIKFLDSIFDQETVNHLINIYKIGTSSRYNGGTTIFWQIDINGNIRTGKLIKFDPNTGRRIQNPYLLTNWVHNLHYGKDYKLQQCLFGEHLLNEDKDAPVAIVESEKTAIIAQARMPDFLWMATGNMQDFKPEKLNILKGRQIVAFPDMGAYDYWLKKVIDLDFDITVSDYLEKNATKIRKKMGLILQTFYNVIN
jgi:hypothetical protein